MKKKPAKRFPNRKPAFLKAIAITGSIREAAIAAKCDRSAHYEWMRTDPAYPALFAAAKAQGDDALEDEATFRAMHGVYEPLVYQGRFQYPQEEYEVTPEIPATPAGDWKDIPAVPATEAVPAVRAWRNVPGAPPIGVWRKSDALLMMRLRGSFAKYRQGTIEVSGPQGGPIPLEQKQLAKLTDDELASLHTLAKKLTAHTPGGSGDPEASA